MASKTRQVRPVPTFDHLAKKKPTELRDWIPLDQEVAEALVTARNERDRQELLHSDDPDNPARVEANKVFESAIDAVKASSVEVVFRALPQPKFKQLKRAHPPTDAQVAESEKAYGGRPDINIDTFTPVLISACCVQPEMTPEQVESLVTEYGWSEAEIQHLYIMALRVNEGRNVVNLDFS